MRKEDKFEWIVLLFMALFFIMVIVFFWTRPPIETKIVFDNTTEPKKEARPEKECNHLLFNRYCHDCRDDRYKYGY